MGRALREITFDSGKVEKEKGCMKYTCKYCGGRATGCNMVAGINLQLYALHNGICGSYVDSDQYVGFISDCSTCKYLGEDEECHVED